ncbi:MAG TPA: putative baseplate assembly protein [Steroidobacteraceae bacterium]|nr:putative baseplate assembly protein [Steroidobacteraceae bacterium]
MSRPCDCEVSNGGGGPVIAPGQSSFAYRAGTYESFFAEMLARLSSSQYLALSGPAGLKTRDADDPAIALCDAWAILADVLTFYQERIANEGYLRTATERRSVIELGRLAGYSLRPGVASNVYLAYTLAKGAQATIDVGQRVQSVPPPGDLPQTFETAELVDTSDAWNTLPVRLTRPQLILPSTTLVYADGITTNLKKNDPVLLVPSSQPKPLLGRLSDVTVQNPDKITLLSLQAPAQPGSAAPAAAAPPPTTQPLENSIDLVVPLSQPPAMHALNALRLDRSVAATLTTNSDSTLSVLTAITPVVEQDFYLALAHTEVAPRTTGEVHALRVQAAPFGHNAPKKLIFNDKGAIVGHEEWPLDDSMSIRIRIDTRLAEDAAATRQLRIGRRLFSVGRRLPEILVTMEMGSVKASADIASPVSTDEVSLGPWSVQVTADDSPSWDFSFGPSAVAREIKVTFVESDQSISVSIDNQAAPISVPHGQSVTVPGHGTRTFVSFVEAIEIHDERALAPEALKVIQLDALYDHIIPGSYVAIERPGAKVSPLIAKVVKARRTSVARYGLTGRVTELLLDQPWLDPTKDLLLSSVRRAVVSAQSELLPLAEEPIVDDVQGQRIELGALYGGLKAGRWLIVEGERTDIPGTPGVNAAELVMLASVTQDVLSSDGSTPLSAAAPASGGTPPQARAGEKTHTFLQLAGNLAYTYKRDNTVIYGNVTRATNGETRVEVLGNGDATASNQSFILHIAPLTFVTASTSAGVQSTLVVTVNDVTWTPVDSLAAAGPLDRVYVTSASDAGVTTVAFGDGVHGARLPTGSANVKAQYRSGIGTAGNVGAGEISLLVSRPSGVQAVVNPLPGAGGADAESRDEARRNVPVGVMALDRLVSAADYAALARTFAGVAKANAVQLRRNGKSLIGLTIAGSADAPVPDGSDLIVNLTSALQQAGGARRPFAIEQRELVLLVAGVTLTPSANVLWENLAPQVRTALVAAFGFDQRDLGQSVALSEFLGVIHGVPGVAAATVTQFDGISRTDADTATSLQAKLASLATAVTPNQTVTALPGRVDSSGAFVPAQLVILSPDIADTLILSQATS